LGEDKPWRYSIGENQGVDAANPGKKEAANKTSDHGTIDSQTAVPDLEDAGERVIDVELVIGSDVVEPGTDKAKRHHEEQGVEG
jgi:hypothetical protein